MAEYHALRTEIVSRTEIQHQLISIAILAAGTILAAGVQNKNPALLLTFPPLSLFLAMSWANNDRRVRQIGAYIKVRIEPRVEQNAMAWERSFGTKKVGWFGTLNFLSARGVFIGSQVLVLAVAAYTSGLASTVVGFLSGGMLPLDAGLGTIVALSLGCLAYTVLIIRRKKVPELQSMY